MVGLQGYRTICGGTGASDRLQSRAVAGQREVFGNLGRGFQRVNVACPRATLTEALERIRRAFTD